MNKQKLNDWQLKEIRKGLEEADRGDFSSDEEIEKLFKKWGVNTNAQTDTPSKL